VIVSLRNRPDFIERGATDALARVEQWPTDLDLPRKLEGRILCNLTWVSHLEYDQLTPKKPLALAPACRNRKTNPMPNFPGLTLGVPGRYN
jgi:hypothetical protein